MGIKLDQEETVFEATLLDRDIRIDGFVFNAVLATYDLTEKSPESAFVEAIVDATKQATTPSDLDWSKFTPAQIAAIGLRVNKRIQDLGNAQGPRQTSPTSTPAPRLAGSAG